MRSPTNADLAKGYDAVIAVSVTGASADPAMTRSRAEAAEAWNRSGSPSG
jgi:hypothetical protein